MQSDLPQNNQTQYLKQYTCFSFPPTYQNNILSVRNVEFQHSRQQYQQLPSVIHDYQNPETTIYLLQWKQQNEQKQLFVKKMKDEGWTLINMNHFPCKICITDDQLFLFGEKQILVLDLVKLEEPIRIFLEAQSIIDVELAYNQKKQSGIYVVYFDQNRGYFSKIYTKSTKITLWQKITRVIKPFYSNHNQYDYFKIIIPHIFAVTIIKNRLFLVDLQNMKLSDEGIDLICDFSESQKIMLKWQLVKPQQGFDDCVQIYLAINDRIQILMLNLVRNQFEVSRSVENDQIEHLMLDQFISGNVVNFHKTQILRKYPPFVAEGAISSFQMTQNLLIYRCHRVDEQNIPVLALINLDNPDEKNVNIISQEMNVWRDYFYCDQIDEMGINQSISESGKKNMKTENSRLADMIIWKKDNTFVNFLKIGSQIFFIRNSSICELKYIEEFQYHLDYYCETMMRQDEKKVDPELYLQFFKNKLGDIDISVQQEWFKKILNNIKVTPNKDSEYQQQTFSKVTILSSYLKDKITFFSRFFNFLKISSQLEDETLKNKIICNIFQFLASTYERNEEINKVLRLNLIDAYLQSVSYSFSGVLEFDFSLVMKNVLEGLLPDSYNESKSKNQSHNQFIDFLISIIVSNSHNQMLIFSIQNIIKKLIDSFYELPSEYFAILLSRNISLFSAFMISHPPRQILVPVLEQIVEKPHEKLLLPLRQIKHLISNQLSVLFQIQMKNSNETILQKAFELLDSKLQKSKMSFKEDEIKIKIPEELVLFRPRESFENSFDSIVELFERCLREDVSKWTGMFSQIQKIRQKQVSLDILHQNSRHILQLEQTLLHNFSALFSKMMANFLQKGDDDDLQSKLLLRILDLIEESFGTYKVHYKQYYRFQNTNENPSNFFEEISSAISEDEAMMTSSILSAPIRILNTICSNTSISIARMLINHSKNMSYPSTLSIARYIIPIILNQKSLKHVEINILYYFLIKIGQNHFKNILSKCNPQKIQQIAHKLQQKRIHSTMTQIINKHLNPEHIPSENVYINPFVRQ